MDVLPLTMMQAASHNFLALLPNLGGGELLILFFIVLLLFGAKRLPDLARGMGKAMHEFKKATNGIEDEVRSAMDTETPPKKTEPKPEAPSVAEATSPAAAESKQSVPQKPADVERKPESASKA